MATLRHRPRSVALLRLAYRAAYRALQVWSFARRPRVRGSMVCLLDGHGRVLLVRHTYGDRRRWELPGGWVKSGEPAQDAAAREVEEELGVSVEVVPLDVLEGDWDFKREQLAAFVAGWPGGFARWDPVEIAEARWFARDDLPPGTGAGTMAVLDRLRATGL